MEALSKITRKAARAAMAEKKSQWRARAAIGSPRHLLAEWASPSFDWSAIGTAALGAVAGNRAGFSRRQQFAAAMDGMRMAYAYIPRF